jgi:hypothetical protein
MMAVVGFAFFSATWFVVRRRAAMEKLETEG